jgi:hypothetical protein
MVSYIEVGVSDFLRLMKSYLDREIDAKSYCSRYFDLMTKRMTISREVSTILQIGFGDADDYDPDLRLEHTILEPALRDRVAKTITELEGLGYTV